jgi:hypothetical protein
LDGGVAAQTGLDARFGRFTAWLDAGCDERVALPYAGRRRGRELLEQAPLDFLLALTVLPLARDLRDEQRREQTVKYQEHQRMLAPAPAPATATAHAAAAKKDFVRMF